MWVYRDNDRNKVGETQILTLVLSGVDGDVSGLNSVPQLIGCDFSDATGVWVIDGDLPDGWELPDDAEVGRIEHPCDGLTQIELVLLPSTSLVVRSKDTPFDIRNVLPGRYSDGK